MGNQTCAILTARGGSFVEKRENTSAAKAADMYGEAASLLNSFFSRRTAVYCRDCLQFHKNASPNDPIAGHVLVGGVFPGCCQEGVADDTRIPFGRNLKLPEALVDEINGNRPPRPTGNQSSYTVMNERDGRLHTGRGCVWIGEGGCTLGPW
jgi:hypothetical protein